MINIKNILISILLCTIGLFSSEYKEIRIDSVAVDIGQSKDDIDIYRLGLRRDFESKWLESRVGYLSGYYELSLNYWRDVEDKSVGIALSPVFRYSFYGSIPVYIEAGIGISLFNSTVIGKHNMSSAFLFEDRAGIGVKFEDFDISFDYLHYSNAGIKKPNEGIDIFKLSLSHKI